MVPMAEVERTKYEEMWNISDYRKISPGVGFVEVFGELAKPQEGEGLLDLGCGSGRAGRKLAKKYGLNVVFLDHVQVSKLNKPFIKQCLWEPIPTRNPKWSYGYCCDVMEHIPVEYVMLVLERIRNACTEVFFSIANCPDVFGTSIGVPLHLVVKPYAWWLHKLREVGEVLDARDLQNESIFYVRMKR